MADGESSVRVAVRIRPLISREKIDMCRVCTSVTPGEPQVWLGSDKAFTYDYMFDMDSEQEHIYSQCTQQLIEGCLDGYNATILAYGQTGSGKTYTMGTGFEMDAGPESAGIIPRAVDHLFRGIQERQEAARRAGQPAADFKISAQFMELYNEEVIDLLDQSGVNRGRKSAIRIHEDAGGGIYTMGVTCRAVTSAEDCLKCLRVGALSRTTASTQMNVQSSRSHAIFTLIIKQMRVARADSGFAGETESADGISSSEGGEQEQPAEFETLSAKFHFVDLAGSERLKRTGATGDRAKEGISINCGLLALGNVISALGDETRKISHVPYRDSKLTRLLQDSLGGNSRTVMIACVSPSDADFMETLNTLKYANRARNIKNRVTINQDKTSRTISLLRQEIQQLQLELMEYRQGKRVVTEDGTEAINDMYHENNMLQTENANLRTRIKAIQETITALTARNTQLLAEKAAGEWIGADPSGDVSELVSRYLQEIEELRARLMESESTCEQLRKRGVNRNLSRLSTSPRHPGTGDVQLSLVEVDSGSVTELIEEARRDLERARTKSGLRRSSSEGGRSSADRETEQSSDSGDENDKDSDRADSEPEGSVDGRGSDDKENEDYNEQLAELTSEITVKQRLIEELERSQRRMDTMRQHYEEKLSQLSGRIRATEQERDKVISNITSGRRSGGSSDEVRKVKDDYEKRLSEMEREMKKLQSAKREHAKLVRSQGQYERQVKTLKSEVTEMKKTKVKLMQRMKDDANKMKQMDLQHHRAMSQLKKEHRKHENTIKSLEAEKRMKDAVLKRKQEEIVALRRLGKPQRTRNRLRLKGSADTTKPFSPAAAKKKWQSLEKTINQLALNKQAVASMEREMERHLKERESLRRRLARVMKQRDKVLLAGCTQQQMLELEETIEGIRANMDYINDSINECQTGIMAMEESKEDLPIQDPAQLVRNMQDQEEMEYLLEKLISMTIHQSCVAAQHEATAKDTEVKMEQMEQTGIVQQQLLQHLLTEEGGLDATVLSLIAEAGQQEPSDGSVSDGEAADQPPAWAAPAPARDKARRKTTTTQELLYSNGGGSGDPSPAGSPAAQEGRGGRSSGGGDADGRLAMPPPPAQTAVPPAFTRSLPQPPAAPPVFSRSLSHTVSGNDTVSGSSRTFGRPDPRPSPLLGRRAYKDSLSPRLARRHVTITNNTFRPSETSAVTPPGSPASYRRQASREENVFHRLTSTGPAQEESHEVGVITPYQGRAGRAPLVCSHVAEGHTKAVLSVCATDDMMLSGSKDRTVKVWDLATGRQVQLLTGHPNNVVCVRYSEAAQMAFSVSSAFVKVWDLRQGGAQCIKTLSSSGLTSATVAVSTPSRTLQMPQGESQINDVCVSGSGLALYTASQSTVRMWDLRKFHSVGKLSGGHQAAIMCLAVDRRRGGDLVLTGSKDHYIKGFEVPDDTNGIVQQSLSLDPPHYDGIQCLVVADGDTLFSGSRDACIKQWDLRRQTLLQSVSNAHRDWICGLSLAPGGQALLSGCRGGVVKLWSVDGCQPLGELKAHNSQINAIAANQSHVFTAANDHTVGLWRLRNSPDADGDPA
ncbi:kinesin-like protein KIF21A isoform X2 [Amphibalanus amphitrite]|uniref:kinesin-like protein KIF21A isoform X2 n=1 Tax=Amphibalanus amphitrite TaxID=1232801 RepID=UPI001C921027|nr:kinesin-like protein KIF21A isoform X2 [Amphibalanus amphitrite]